MCEYNACRSQLGEAIARTLLPPTSRVLSAGLTATGVDRRVVDALNELEIDCASQTSKSLESIEGRTVDDAFVLAAPALAAVRAAFPRSRIWDWSMDDPLHAAGGAAAVAAAVRETCDEIARHLVAWRQEQLR